MTNINPDLITMTIGVSSMQGKGFDGGADEDYLFQSCLKKVIKEQFEKEPDKCTDGGNDKEFFVVYFREKKIFVAVNEVGGLTVMLPEEY